MIEINLVGWHSQIIGMPSHLSKSCLLMRFLCTMADKKFRSSTTVIPLTYAIKQPLGTNNLTSHVDMCHSNCVCSYG
jgi:hypothetical protein